MFYIVYDKTMRGCTIVTTEPSDKTRYKRRAYTKPKLKLRKQSPRSMNAEMFG